MSVSLLSRYETIVASGLIKRDPRQLSVLGKLEGLCYQLKNLEERGTVLIHLEQQSYSMRRTLVFLVVFLIVYPSRVRKSRGFTYMEVLGAGKPC